MIKADVDAAEAESKAANYAYAENDLDYKKFDLKQYKNKLGADEKRLA